MCWAVGWRNPWCVLQHAYEYARTVEDVLARRSPLLFLDAALAADIAPAVAQLLWAENEIDPQYEAFLVLCQQYQLPPL